MAKCFIVLTLFIVACASQEQQKQASCQEIKQTMQEMSYYHKTASNAQNAGGASSLLTPLGGGAYAYLTPQKSLHAVEAQQHYLKKMGRIAGCESFL